MQLQRARCSSEPSLDPRAPRHWQDVAQGAQQDLAEALASAARGGRLNRQTYQHWLAMESAVCRLNALALDAVAEWHVSQPHLRSVVHAWATAMRDDALLAAADVRAIDGMAGATPQPLVPWQGFLEAACRSSRVGEALGAVVLHATLLRGPVRSMIPAITQLPFVPPRGSRYLVQRTHAHARPITQEREALIDGYSATALAVGAQRAAAWHRAALEMVLRAPLGEARLTHAS